MFLGSDLKTLSKEKLKETLQTTLNEIETKASELSKEKELLKSSAANYEKTQELTKYIREKISVYENILSNLIPLIEANVKKEQEAINSLKAQRESVSDKKKKIKELKNQRKKELYGEKFDNIPLKKEIETNLSRYKSELKICKEKLVPTAEQSVTDKSIKLMKEMSEFDEKLDNAKTIISSAKTKSKSINYGEMNAMKENLDKELNELKTKYSELLESSTKKENFNYIQTLNIIISLGFFILKTLSTASLTALGMETTKEALFSPPSK